MTAAADCETWCDVFQGWSKQGHTRSDGSLFLSCGMMKAWKRVEGVPAAAVSHNGVVAESFGMLFSGEVALNCFYSGESNLPRPITLQEHLMLACSQALGLQRCRTVGVCRHCQSGGVGCCGSCLGFLLCVFLRSSGSQREAFAVMAVCEPCFVCALDLRNHANHLRKCPDCPGAKFALILTWAGRNIKFCESPSLLQDTD